MPIASFEEENKLIQETSSGAQSQHFLGMSGWLVRKGLASNQTSADLTLLVLSGFIVVLSFGVYFVLKPSPGADRNVPPIENLQRMHVQR